MAGRYAGELFIRVDGDRDAAPAYLTAARALMGETLEQASFNGLGTHKLVHRMQDGAVLVAEKIGDINRVTISPPAGAQQLPEVAPPMDFVVWPRNAALPDGISAEHPQQILRPPGGSRGEWLAYTFDADTAGRRDGTYGGRLPGGIRRAGNIDWCGMDQVRVSWYGPPNRIAAEPFVYLRAQYDTKVFYLGSALLDVDAYQAASPPDGSEAYKWVLGACLRKVDGAFWLYTIQTYLPASNPVPPESVPPGAAACSDPLAAATNSVVLARYKLQLVDDQDVAKRWQVLAGGREVRKVWSAPNAFHPWRFSEDGLRASSMAGASGDAHVVAWEEQGGFYQFTTPPAPSALRYDLDVDGLALVTSTLSITGPVSWAPLFRDFARDEQGETLERTLELGRFTRNGKPTLGMRFDGLQVPLVAYDVVQAGSTVQLHAEQNALLYACPRDRVYVFLHFETNGTVEIGSAENPAPSETARIHVYRGGVQVSDTQTHSTYGRAMALGLSHFTYTTFNDQLEHVSSVGAFFNDRLKEQPLSPLHVLCGVWLTGNISSYVYDQGQASITMGHAVNFLGALYGRTPWPGPNYFGWYRNNVTTSPQPGLPVAGAALPGFDTDRMDFDGKPSIIGCATIERFTLYSGPGFSGAFSDDSPVDVTGESVHRVDAGQLPVITGVAGLRARFHPVWVLGKPIEETA